MESGPNPDPQHFKAILIAHLLTSRHTRPAGFLAYSFCIFCYVILRRNNYEKVIFFVVQGEEQEYEEVDQLGDNLAPVVGKEEYKSTYYINSADPDSDPAYFPQCGSGFETMLCL
jgi:hypothetical protein